MDLELIQASQFQHRLPRGKHLTGLGQNRLDHTSGGRTQLSVCNPSGSQACFSTCGADARLRSLDATLVAIERSLTHELSAVQVLSTAQIVLSRAQGGTCRNDIRLCCICTELLICRIEPLPGSSAGWNTRK